MAVRQYAGWPPPIVRADNKTLWVRCPEGTSTTGGTRLYKSYISVKELEEAPAAEQKRLVLTIGPVGSEGGTLEVWFPLEGVSTFGDGSVHVRRGCFSDTLEAFEAEVGAKRTGAQLELYRRIIAAIRLIEG